MRYFSAQYIFTNTGAPLKRGIITTDDDGLILKVEDTGGRLNDRALLEYYNGIIIPGMVNCHCHLELSHLKGRTKRGTGLGSFIEQIRDLRGSDDKTIETAARQTDRLMTEEGVVLCSDICNTEDTFSIKRNSRIKYINLIEVFGIDPSKAEKRIEEALWLKQKSEEYGIPCNIVPHSFYSVSLTLLRLLKQTGEKNSLTSVHFMESAGEKDFLLEKKGPVAESYIRSGLMPPAPETVRSHSAGVKEELTCNGNLLLVHNTFADKEPISEVSSRNNTFWCLCPGSNLYIEGKLPPVHLLIDSGCKIVTGTDSIASNDTISMLNEMKILQQSFPFIKLADLIEWATINGAVALSATDTYGTIEPGKRPGLVLLSDPDLENLKLLPGTYSKRLI